jgi:hypothetical protein
MSAIKYFLFCINFFISISLFAQRTESVFLKWKLKPNEDLYYKTVMEEIDTANYKDFAADELFKSIGGTGANVNEMKKMFKQINKAINISTLIAHLQERRKNIIDIDLSVNNDTLQKPVTDTGKMGVMLKGLHEMIKKSGGVMLRGTINEDGTIESFYTKNDQKNLLAVMFELPGRMVKVGDSWSLNVNFLSMDQNFVCDSSYKKNSVTVTSIDSQNGDYIVTLKYDIVEYVNGNFNSPFNNEPLKTTMKMSYKGIAEFSTEKGRWMTFNGIMSLSSTGMMSSQSTKRFSLIAN